MPNKDLEKRLWDAADELLANSKLKRLSTFYGTGSRMTTGISRLVRACPVLRPGVDRSSLWMGSGPLAKVKSHI